MDSSLMFFFKFCNSEQAELIRAGLNKNLVESFHTSNTFSQLGETSFGKEF